MRTTIKHKLRNFTEIVNPPIDHIAIGFDTDGIYKAKTPNGVIRNLEYALIDITYDALVLLQTNSLLVPLQKYRITDFQTKHAILDGNIVTTDFNIGILEPLIIQATSINTFDKQVYSELHPFDIIYYDITGGDTRDIAFFDTGVAITGLKGVIYYRKDTVQNVECWYDFRNVKYRRWLVDATDWVASGTYVAKNVYEYENILYKCLVDHIGVVTTPDLDTINWIKWLDKTQNWSWTSDKTQFKIGDIIVDNLIMSAPIDVYTFGDYYKWVNNITIGKIDLNFMIEDGDHLSVLNGIVFITEDNVYTCKINEFKSNCFNVTIGNSFYNNKIHDYFRNIIVGNDCLNNIFNFNCYRNVLGSLFHFNDIGSIFADNITLSNFNHNTSIYDIIGINLIPATHVYGDYSCEIFKNSAGVLRLKYVDGTDADVIVDITS